jgi:hypothetical protein
MPTSKQLAHQSRKIHSAIKQDAIGVVYSAVLHILHDSSLYGSSLWPSGGIIAGFPREIFIDDSWYVGVSIRGTESQWMYINIHSESATRAKEQALILDMILDESLYDGVHITVWLHEKLGTGYRYHLSGPAQPNKYYMHLPFKFTIQQ